MKKKSNSKLAFFSLRVLPSLVAAAFIALAVALSNSVGDMPSRVPSVGDTPSCTPTNITPWPGAPTPSPTLPMLTTAFYLADPTHLNSPKPVLVSRGCGATSGDPCFLWPAGAQYHMVLQENRGSPGCLENAFIGDLLFKYDQDDSHTLLGYINQQGWGGNGSGHLAMYGWSRFGFISYLAAPGAGTYLRGIQPHYATGDVLNYVLFNGGVLHNEIGYPVDLPQQSPNPISWKDYVGLGIWDKYLITDNDAGSANVAGLHVGGWFDAFGQGTLDSFSRLQTAGGSGALGRQKVVIGPWLHGGEGSPGPVGEITFPNSTDIYAGVKAGGPYDAAWKQCVLQQTPDCTAWNNTNTLPAVKVYLMIPGPTPSGVWTTYTTWPPPAQEKTFYFTTPIDGSSGLSSVPQATPGQRTFTSNPSNPCPTLGGTNNLDSCGTGGTCGPYNQSPIEARSDVVVFTSVADPLTNGGPIVGRMYADVWIKTPLPDVDVFVRMTDVYPNNGASMLMAQGIQRARYRDGGACPHLPLDLSQPTKVRVDLGSTALKLGTGHKLRVIVSATAGKSLYSSLDPLYSVNPQNGNEYLGDPPNGTTGSINVLAGPGQSSALVVPQAIGSRTPPDHRPPKPTPCPN
jgi:predicted acyl esterase